MANNDQTAMTPVAAVVRHLEWLEFALAAARDEETRRRERLGRATDKNRDRRTVRLAEVSAEVRELGALVKGLKELQSRPGASRAASSRSGARSTGKAKAARATRSKAVASAGARAAAATNPSAATAKPKATATAKPKAAATAKPKAAASAKPKTATKPRARRRTRKPSTPSA
jgi:hypothetical protein